ncbi:D-aminoacyl-tRNA deacylase [Alicyclobacillus shizuokensis]|uniref:D-aminoacyl-tRNA deacylase n=1 Tax=Alicyclobacillus shizuokensis TaxID=392014 RepID=UPI00082ED602|nr:D-aminoacyl-tRNA deacylase [Alicyclobacillus shizuokensis]MCL6626789.1 D-tyrosyl-tRNA(Tyr) deacylase [Alicyclobacillus shizuokensis]
MRAVVQRSGPAEVTVGGRVVGRIDHGLVVLLGVGVEDTEQDADYVADKVARLRIFEDETGRMNRDVLAVGGAILSISQFTLYGDVRKGRRPNYMAAAAPELARALYDRFNARLRGCGLRVETGRFGAMMQVSLVNDGPVTILVDSKRGF